MSLPSQLAPRNLLLRALAHDDWLRLQPDLTHVVLDAKNVLSTPSAPIRHVDFVEDGIISVVAIAGERQIEVALIGREGMTGVPVLHGATDTPHHVSVQVPGSALRIDADRFRDAVAQSPTLRQMLLRFAHVLQIQMAHTAVVNGHFTIEQRLARWILMCDDRIGPDLSVTHEFVAVMLGTRRAGVTETIHVLASEQMIRATRARIIVRDRARLIRKAGDSYGLPEAEYEKAFGRSLRSGRSPVSGLAAKRILIVEDEYQLATEMQGEFTGRGVEVIGPVPSVDDALSLLIATPALDGAIVDINLRGETAFPLAEALRKRNVPFVFVSGYQRSIVPSQFSDVKFYNKPVKTDDIAMALSVG